MTVDNPMERGASSGDSPR